jgi:iron-sulfur cluster assembly protein
MALALTETAVKQVKQLMETQNLGNVYLRVGVKGGGCSGLSYQLEFDNEIGPHDKKFDIDGVQVVCDKKSYLYLNGTTLDYVTQGLQGGFTFVNPTAKSRLWVQDIVLRLRPGSEDTNAGPAGPLLF